MELSFFVWILCKKKKISPVQLAREAPFKIVVLVDCVSKGGIGNPFAY